MLVPGAEGLFVRDTRILSRFELRVNGARPEALAVVSDDPFSATFVSRCPPQPGRADSTLMVFRRRFVGQGMREDIVISNFGDEPTFCSVELFLDCDFADLFAVKEGRVGDPDGEVSRERRDSELEFTYRRGTVNRGLVVRLVPRPAVVAEDLVTFEAIVPAPRRMVGMSGIPSRDRRQGRGSPLPVRPARRPLRPGRAPGQMAAPGPADRDGPRGSAVGDRLERRGPGRPAHLRPRLPRTRGGGGGRPVVHDRLRSGLPHHVVDGAARRPRSRSRGAPDPGALPGAQHRPPQRGTARPDPARDAFR